MGLLGIRQGEGRIAVQGRSPDRPDEEKNQSGRSVTLSTEKKSSQSGRGTRGYCRERKRTIGKEGGYTREEKREGGQATSR